MTVGAASPSVTLSVNNGAGRLSAASNAFFTVADAASLNGEWHTFGNGPSHTGYFPGSLGDNGLASLQWSATMASSQVAVAAGRVYASSGSAVQPWMKRPSPALDRPFRFGGFRQSAHV